MIDPRIAVIERRLAPIGRIVAVTGGKGGIGKTLVSSTLALALAASGRRVGLLDLDFTGPCAHLVIGAEQVFPDEDFGILPQNVAGVQFMSISCFAGEDPAPLRGVDLSNALIELLAITRWGKLDVLVVDMPPGLGDVALDTVQLLPRAEYLVVANGGQLVAQTVRRSLALLRQLQRHTLGIVENMAASVDPAATVTELAQAFDVAVLGVLPQDAAVEAALGRPDALLATSFGQGLSRVSARVA